MATIFHAASAIITTCLTSIFLGHHFIIFFKKNFENSARAFTPQNHEIKGKTPTMGGIFIITATILNSFLWCNAYNLHIGLIIFALILFACIGYIDDWYKIQLKKGINARLKFRLQLGCALALASVFVYNSHAFSSTHIVATVTLISWLTFIIIGTSNAVNLTDGLDGLAAGILTINFIFFAMIAYSANQIDIFIICATLIGSLLGFLWFNSHPAQIFMGDVGSLALGGCLAMIAIALHQEWILVISGGVFVAETISVILQVFWFKKFKKRLLKMAPLHHHLELSGWSETTITNRLYIITILLCLIASIFLTF